MRERRLQEIERGANALCDVQPHALIRELVESIRSNEWRLTDLEQRNKALEEFARRIAAIKGGSKLSSELSSLRHEAARLLREERP